MSDPRWTVGHGVVPDRLAYSDGADVWLAWGEDVTAITHNQHLCPACGEWRDLEDKQCKNCGSRRGPVLWKGGGD